jgi:Fe(3+) dicitrate transport protein
MTRRVSRVRAAGVIAFAALGSSVVVAQDGAVPPPPHAYPPAREPKPQEKPAAPATDETAPPKPAPAKPQDDLDAAVEGVIAGMPEEVVVTGTRAPEVPLSWSGARTIIGPEEMRRAGQATLQDVLHRIPGVHVEDEAGIDTKPNFSVRGVKAERSTEITVLVDGIPLASAPYLHPGQSLFAFVMERAWAVDAIRSGFATRYGPNNVVGVINYLTAPIPHEPMVEERVRFGEDGYQSYYTSAGGTFGDFGILVEDVEKRGDTFRDNGAFDIASRGVKMSWRISDQARVLVQYDVFNENERLAGGMSDADYDEDRNQSVTPEDWFAGDQQRGNVRFIWEPDRDTRLELLAYAYSSFRTFHLGSPNQYGDSPTSFNDTPRRFTVAAFAPTFSKSFRVVDDVRNSLAVGGRIQRELGHTVTDRTTVSTGAVERRADQVHEYLAIATWAEDTVRIWDRVSLTGGVRTESIDIDALDRLTDFTVDEDVTKTMPAYSASVDVLRDVSVFASKYEGFRAPSYSQVIPSPNYEGIELEESRSFDYGVRALLWDGGLSAEATHFDIDFDNRFITDPADPDHQINAGEQEQWGWELGVNSDLGKLTDVMRGFRVYATATLLDTEQQSGEFEGNELSDTPNHTYAWGASYGHDCGAYVGVDGVYVGESYGDQSNDETPSADGVAGLNPSYTLWSARIGFDTPLDKDHKWNAGVEVGVTNLFDKETFNRFGTRGVIPIAPRSAYVACSLSVTF